MQSNEFPFSQTIGSRHFGTTPEGQEVTEYTLTNNQGLVMKVINYGCTITALMVPDRNGVWEDIVLGFDQLEGYLQSDQSIGCIVGRFANRIAYGKFSLAGKEISLDCNLPPHHIHGGLKNFGRVVWSSKEIQEEKGVGVLFRHLSPDGDEGYPGNLKVEIKYFLGHDNTLSFEYFATTDKDTIINLTQHSYFNLNGGKRDVLDHELAIFADHFLPVDESMIPTGEIQNVSETPFDFRKQKRVGRDIEMNDAQLTIGHGYDHCWVLKNPYGQMHHAATLHDRSSGRKMDVYTDEPGVQLYTANFLESNVSGKNKGALAPRAGLCLETQHFPDSPNQSGFPTVVLYPNESYYSKTVLTFNVH
ncbi:MAG: aldose epimerase family protein [Saprospiraceae bacterium]|nr:aldose epimerase family protein [Saprospiraceae bacterium]